MKISFGIHTIRSKCPMQWSRFVAPMPSFDFTDIGGQRFYFDGCDRYLLRRNLESIWTLESVINCPFVNFLSKYIMYFDGLETYNTHLGRRLVTVTRFELQIQSSIASLSSILLLVLSSDGSSLLHFWTQLLVTLKQSYMLYYHTHKISPLNEHLQMNLRIR